MIHPSYVDLMQVVNSNVEEGDEPVISSRYSIVMATARRARQIIAGDEALVRVRRGEKALSIAVDELNEGMIHILTEEEKAEMEEFAFEHGIDYDVVHKNVVDYVFNGKISDETIRESLSDYHLGLLKTTKLTGEIKTFVSDTYAKYRAEGE